MAEDAFKQCRNIFPEHPITFLAAAILAGIYAEDGRTAEAAKLAESYVALMNENRRLTDPYTRQAKWMFADVFYQLAKSLPWEANHRQAIEDLDEAIRLYKECLPEAASDLAWAYYQRGWHGNDQAAILDFSEAISFFAMVEDDSGLALAYFERGLALCHFKRFEDAITDYDNAIRLYTEHLPETASLLAWAYHSRGFARWQSNHEDAISDFNEAISRFTKVEHDSGLALANVDRGRVLCDLKRFEEAIADFSVAIPLLTKESELGIGLDKLAACYSDRGRALIQLGKHAEAIKDFSKAIELEEDNAQYYQNSGIAWEALDDGFKARADFAKAKELGLEKDDVDP